MAILLLLVLATVAGRASDDDATNHWSFQPIARPPLPPTRNPQLATRNPIDSFIRAKLAERGLEPAPEADRRTLIRRLYFDLVGLPPTPEEVSAFLCDPRPDSYERLVERLLASPRFGERWARHWLDVVRFAETHGFEMNQPRPNAWPYRDYVIRAFNEDKPYDRFILEQIAGDALGADEATGFLVAGPWDQVKSPDEVLTKNQRADELHDIVSTTATAFLAITVGCARCHDHKFDPVPQSDYYALKAVFEGVHHGERPRPVGDAAARARATDAEQARLLEIEAELSGFERIAQTGPNIDSNRLRAPVNPRLNVERFAPVAAKRLRFTIDATTDGEPCLDELEVYAAGQATIETKPEQSPSPARGQVRRSGSSLPLDSGRPAANRDGSRSDEFPTPGHVSSDSQTSSPQNEMPGSRALRNVALASLGVRSSTSGTYPNSELHKLEHLNDGRVGNSHSWISNENGKGWVILEFPEPITIHRVVWGRDREEKFKDRLATDYRIEIAGEDEKWKVVASSADRRPFKAGEAFTRDYDTNGLSDARLARWASLATEQKTLEARVKQLSAKPMVYAGEFQLPEPTHRFHRGDPVQPREVIEPGALSRIAVKHERNAAGSREGEDAKGSELEGGSATSATAPEQQRRLALAQWIAAPEHPLTARVIVNRLWQSHFGEGLVSTPSDFGRNGGKPTHPELLDWLAAELVEHGWSLKHIHRIIVTSQTYRQSSSLPPEQVGKWEGVKAGSPPAHRPTFSLSTHAAAKTPETDTANRLLGRFQPRRLEAESLRDSILAVAGRLDLRMGGPGWSPFEPNDNYVRVYAPKQAFGPEDLRRMVYATVVRQRPDGVFGVFDCPDGGQIAPKRNRSTTPLQALNLLNSGFMMQAAGFLAERLEREAGNRVEAQVRLGFLLAFQREPAPEEVRASARLIREQGLKVFCRALFNANEFVYIF